MIINSNTKIGALLKYNPDALEVIIDISSKFNKLRNPVLRKLMAGRTSIATACKIGGCETSDFLEKLKPLGFEIDTTDLPLEKEVEKPVPDFIKNLKAGQVEEFDVRSIIAGGEDPLKLILQKVKTLPTGRVLKIINSFEPVPLMMLLGKQGFESHSEIISDNLVNTYFLKNSDKILAASDKESDTSEGWDEIHGRFKRKLKTIDVRELEMPMPMHTILEALDQLPDDEALYVYHKRIPVFLLPELAERNFHYRIKEVSDSEVHLLIFKG